MVEMSRQQQRQKSSRVAEVAGSTTAEIVAVCCCVPFMVADAVVLTTVKVPAALWRRRAMMRRKKTEAEVMLLRPKRYEDMEFAVDTVSWENLPEKSPAREVLEAEQMMWGKFGRTGNGFWRSPSERED